MFLTHAGLTLKEVKSKTNKNEISKIHIFSAPPFHIKWLCSTRKESGSDNDCGGYPGDGYGNG